MNPKYTLLSPDDYDTISILIGLSKCRMLLQSIYAQIVENLLGNNTYATLIDNK